METEFVLFDFDGVIANTEESNAAYLEKALSAFGIQLTDDDRKALIGTNDKARSRQRTWQESAGRWEIHTKTAVSAPCRGWYP